MARAKEASREDVAKVQEQLEKGREELEKKMDGRGEEMQSLVQSGRQGRYSVLS